MENFVSTKIFHLISDPYNNARCAYQIWQRQGYRAWNCYARTQISSLEKEHF